MDIAPKNQFVSLKTLETYVEKYPEDAAKWLEFINIPEDTDIRRLRRNPLDDTLINAINTSVESVPDIPIEHYRDGCLFCKKSWLQTSEVPTLTLICGHKYHTVCSFVDQYSHDYPRCIVDECDIDTWDYINKIVRRKEKAHTTAEEILLESYRKTKEFKDDLDLLKKNISDVTRAHSSVTTLLESARKEFIHKHLASINHMQTDLNEGVKLIQESEQMNTFKTSLRAYRRNAGTMFRKYHVSFRNLREKRLVRSSWKIRWVLERHRTAFSYYKLGFRMYPKKRLWKDPLT